MRARARRRSGLCLYSTKMMGWRVQGMRVEEFIGAQGGIQPCADVVRENLSESLDKSLRVLRRLLDDGEALDEDGQEDVEEDNCGDDEEREPKDSRDRRHVRGHAQHAVVVVDADGQSRREEHHHTGSQLPEAVELRPKHKLAHDCVHDQDKDEDDGKVRNVVEGIRKGARDEAHPPLKVQRLEEARRHQQDVEADPNPADPRHLHKEVHGIADLQRIQANNGSAFRHQHIGRALKCGHARVP